MAAILDPPAAATVISRGGVIATPSESVYGLSCDPHIESAVRRILAIKERSEDAGLIVVGSAWEHLRPFAAPLGDNETAPARESWPGPVTWLFPAAEATPRWITGRHASVALRQTDHPGLAALCTALGAAVISTSANRSGESPARTAAEVAAMFAGAIDGILAGEPGGRERPSRIVDLASGRIIREG